MPALQKQTIGYLSERGRKLVFLAFFSIPFCFILFCRIHNFVRWKKNLVDFGRNVNVAKGVDMMK